MRPRAVAVLQLRELPSTRGSANRLTRRKPHGTTGLIQSLLTTCRLHDINPYTYLVDVLQRIGEHPTSRVDELTPRRWKSLFADQPLRSHVVAPLRK